VSSSVEKEIGFP